jgi:Protein of unknown function (DUF3168)
MTIEADLFTALSSLVENRVYPLAFPQTGATPPVWPGIRYTLVSVVPAIALCGDSGDEAADTRVQLDVVDRTYSDMRALRLEVLEAMRTFSPPAILENTSDDYDSETKTYRCTVDYIIYKSAQLAA